MNDKTGRNDPCPCGSGKKYKSCCLSKQQSKYSQGKRKFSAKWVNAPSQPNLIERTFGASINATGHIFKPSLPSDKKKDESSEDIKNPMPHLENPLHPQDK